MASNYPGALDSLTNPTSTDTQAAVDHAAQHANANDAIEAIEGELGTNPSGSAATVGARLTTIEGDARWTDTRTPTAHASSHASGGSDALTLAQSQVTSLTTDLAAKAFSASKSGRWLTGNIGTMATAVMTADRLYLNLFPVHTTITVDTIGIETTSAGSANSVIRLGIYRADANCVDFTKVLDAGTVAGTSIATLNIAISQQLTPGLYGLVCVGQGSPATQPTTRSSSVQMQPASLVPGTSQANVGSNGAALIVAGITGALPDTLTTLARASSTCVTSVRIA